MADRKKLSVSGLARGMGVSRPVAKKVAEALESCDAQKKEEIAGILLLSPDSVSVKPTASTSRMCICHADEDPADLAVLHEEVTAPILRLQKAEEYCRKCGEGRL
jgi:hypothetical protein